MTRSSQDCSVPVCLCECVWREKKSSNPVYSRRLFSKHRMHSRTIVFCQKDKHRKRILNFWLSRPQEENKKWMNSPRILIWDRFMVARIHDWNGFSAQNCLFTVNYKGYWHYGRCQDSHYIFRSCPALHCMKMINECLLTAVYARKSRKKKKSAFIKVMDTLSQCL